jgi:hypothetical protein
MCKCGNAFSLLVLIGRAAWPQNNWHNRTNNGSVLVSKLNLKHETPKTNLQFSVAIARRQHPFPSRTRKLSSSAPMVLPGKLGGRVGRRRNFFKTRNHILIPGLFVLTLKYCFSTILLFQELFNGKHHLSEQGLDKLPHRKEFGIEGQTCYLSGPFDRHLQV